MNFEFYFLDLIQSIRTPFWDTIMPAVTKLGDAGIMWIVLTIILLLIPKTRRSGLIMAVALLADLIICNGILKNLFCRIRPYDVNTGIQLLIKAPGDYSFPSGHTAASFAAVSALYFAGERKLLKPALFLAVLIAFSRMYLYVHYPTDILGGIFVGIFAGYIGLLIVDKCIAQIMNRRIQK